MTVDVTSWALSQLRVTPPAESDVDFALTVTATSIEAANSHQAQNIASINVVIEAVADQPTLTVPSTITVDEDTQSAAFTVSSSLTDLDGSETLLLEIGDIPVGATLTDGVHAFVAASGATSVNVTNWILTDLTVTAPTNSDQDFTLTVAATVTESANGDQSVRSDSIDVTVVAVADTPSLTVPATVTVDEDTQSASFTIISSLDDTDGSEALQLEISEVPVGATLSDGTNSFVATAGNTVVDVTAWSLSDLTITPAANSDQDFVLTITSTATEGENGDLATNVDTISVEVAAVADAPKLIVPSTIAVDEDTQSTTFTISSTLTDTDGSESLQLVVGNVPAGATLTDGVNTFTATAVVNSVDVTSWNLNALQLTAPADSDRDFTLSVTATATEAANVHVATNSDSIDVVVTAVADQPSLIVPSTITVNEDAQSAAFTISSAPNDTDGSESLIVEVSNVPPGTSISDGLNTFTASIGATTVDVSSWNLANLTLTPSSDSDQDFTLTVTSTATEAANSDQATTIDTIDVEVNAVADVPSLTVPSTVTTDEDTHSASFAVSTALQDTDGSETLRLEVSDIPIGATLTDGTNLFTATLGSTTADITSWSLASLTVTPPAHSDVDFTLSVTSTATEAANGDVAQNSDTINIHVTAVADQPTLTVPSTIMVNEDTASASFTIISTLQDADGSETLQLEIDGVPVGATLTDGTNSFTGSAGNQKVDVTNWTLSSLTVTPPVDSDVDFTLTVIATATEGANSDQNSNTGTINVDVTAVADQPNLTVPASITVDEDTNSAAFVISSSLTDTDGSESLQLEVAGVPVGSTLTDGTHVFVASTGNTTVDVTAWTLSSLSVTPPEHSDVDFTLSVTATAVEAANSDQKSTTDTIAVAVAAVADAPTLTVPATVTVNEDTQSASFAIASAPVDTDGSESLVISISGLPVGTQLNDGANSFIATVDNTTINVTGWTLSNLMITPPADSDVDFTLTVAATTTESGNGDVATTTDSINVVVEAVADTPTLTVPSTLTVDEDTSSASFAMSAALVDTDGSESLTIEISDMPVGMMLTDGTNTFVSTTGNQQVDVTGWTLGSLSLTPPANSDVDFNLTVTATVTEAENGDQATRVDSINVQVNAVADQPNLTVPATITVDEDIESAAFTIDATLPDMDGSESLVLQIGNVPVGAIISDGVNVFTAATGNTTVDISTWSLTGLTVTPPANSDVDFSLTVTATSTEAVGGEQATRSDRIDVAVTAVADQPDLIVPSTITVDEDTSSATFSILASLNDTDGSEALQVMVSDLPDGTTITDGTTVFVASTGNTSVDISSWNLATLSVTPPTDSSTDFSFTVIATATEAANGNQAVTVDEIDVQVVAIADQPILIVPSTISPPVDEDTQSDVFTISAELTGSPGTETLTIEVSDIPTGVTFTDGTNSFTATAGITTVDITNWTLTNLSVTPPADSDVDFSLTVTATATETANGDQVSRVDSVNVLVTAVADAPR